jgi:parallel beta-helix repeat protein
VSAKCHTTISAPASISSAENAASPGDVVCLHGGVYAQVVTLSHSGTSASPITVTSYPGESAILDGSGASLGSSNGIVTVSGNYVTLSNVELRNSSGRGVSLTGTGDVVSKNKLHDMKFNGLIAAGTNEVIEGNEVWNTVMSNQNDSRGSAGWAEAMNAWQATNTTFRNNYIHDNWGEGIDFIDSNGGVASGNTVVDDFSVLIYVDGSKNIAISGNHLATTKSTFYRASKPPPGVLMADERGTNGVANITITNNVMSHTGGISTWNVTPSNLVVSGNTIS